MATQRSERRTMSIAVIILAVSASTTTGCRRVLFPNKADRTQFDAYDRIREGVAPPHVVDEFGYRRPNLRERLIRPE